ncbi:MAG: methyltransferase domain-containing protein [Candidatus Delongbacteria bacterium]|jgi:SAM-dependent methyltransferase|nr:methyltransferase domain-containing protein [Candidatus Delongbacteria bacterium]
MNLKIVQTEELNIEECFAVNKDAWNKKVRYDVMSSYYDLNRFKHGENSLKSLDLSLLGDVSGKKVLHLQSYFGLDTISLNRIGATATGVDFCNNAIEFAGQLNEELNTNTEFLNSNVYELEKLNLPQFDIVYMSYGAICWLPDLNTLWQQISKLLKPNGIFILVDFHPLAISFDLFKEEQIKHSYFESVEKPIEIHRKGTYADIDAPIETTEYNWNHSIDEILNAFIQNKLSIEHFREHPFLPIKGFPNLQLQADGNYHVIDSNDKYPLLFSIKAKKK